MSNTSLEKIEEFLQYLIHMSEISTNLSILAKTKNKKNSDTG